MGTLMHERGTFGAGLQVNYQRNFNRLVEIAHRSSATASGSGRSGDPAEAGAVLRRNRSDALQSDARVQPDQ